MFKVFITSFFLIIAACSTINHSLQSSSERKVELENQLDKVVTIYSWQDFSELAPLMLNNNLSLIRKVSTRYRDVKIKEVLVDDIVYDDDVKKANVRIEVLSFTAPAYIVTKHFEIIKWEFSATNNGWKIKNISLDKNE